MACKLLCKLFRQEVMRAVPCHGRSSLDEANALKARVSLTPGVDSQCGKLCSDVALSLLAPVIKAMWSSITHVSVR